MCIGRRDAGGGGRRSGGAGRSLLAQGRLDEVEQVELEFLFAPPHHARHVDGVREPRELAVLVDGGLALLHGGGTLHRVDLELDNPRHEMAPGQLEDEASERGEPATDADRGVGRVVPLRGLRLDLVDADGGAHAVANVGIEEKAGLVLELEPFEERGGCAVHQLVVDGRGQLVSVANVAVDGGEDVVDAGGNRRAAVARDDGEAALGEGHQVLDGVVDGHDVGGGGALVVDQREVVDGLGGTKALRLEMEMELELGGRFPEKSSVKADAADGNSRDQVCESSAGAKM
ncbi:hypothetical protein BU23DRAFT_636151 [Bimuria novae-zelandiae CBS 107.79]|uniref:Uncharacterized protein n=1 Tax=Bimuria novae-zelandiae CBS 107.79 TaxID=1447943 RepID=A0A6A5VBM9_9PLEO|nr:hypothetical protein BU23DRAFT_636151 [Bimuria novae-zelandiae CBS 107.79]